MVCAVSLAGTPSVEKATLPVNAKGEGSSASSSKATSFEVAGIMQ